MKTKKLETLKRLAGAFEASTGRVPHWSYDPHK